VDWPTHLVIQSTEPVWVYSWCNWISLLSYCHHSANTKLRSLLNKQLVITPAPTTNHRPSNLANHP
jgi:hypothetical protein